MSKMPKISMNMRRERLQDRRRIMRAHHSAQVLKKGYEHSTRGLIGRTLIPETVRHRANPEVVPSLQDWANISGGMKKKKNSVKKKRSKKKSNKSKM